MEEIKPKKEKRFLKAVGKVAGILIQEFVLGLGNKFISKKIDKIGNKRQALLIFLALFCNIAWASVDSIPYPITSNKQRLGWQTSGNGLVYRGRASDTITKPSNYTNKDIKAYLLVDTVNNVMYSYIASKGGWKFNNTDTVIIQGATMPFDSITFNTAKDGTVGVGEVEYNDTQGSLIQGLKGGNVTNVIGQQLHQRVNNRTGAALSKGDVVYLSGSQGNRITVAKAIATSDPTSANTFGIVAESIADNASGYVITEGLITGLNTSALIQDSAVYLSGTTAGVLTSIKPQAPIHGVYIGVCVKTNAGSGEVFVKIRNGQELDELHDVQITSPVNNSSLYYKSSEGLWRDTTAALLVSDTASMLTNYLRTNVAALTYLTQSNAASTYLPLTGGTLTGALNGTTGTFTTRLGVGSSASINPTIFSSGTGDQEIHFTHSDNVDGRKINLRLTNNNNSFYSYGGLIYAIQGEGINQYNRMTLGINTTEILHLTRFSRVGIMNNSPSYTLDVNGTFNATGNSLIGGTLGVTGATTLSNLAGSGTRMVTATSTGLLGTQNILTPTTRGSNTFTLPDIGAISFLRYNADNTVSQRAADGMRSDLGGTTIGQSMFTLTNPSAITFPRFNADNTVSALSAADFRTAIGAGTGNGNGTVTSVTAGSPANGLSVASTTTTPVISMALAGSATTGVVSATTQTFGGAKTFAGDINGSSALNITGFSTLTGGASIGTMATTSSLTHVLGVNSSNAIGEIGVSDGIKFTSGFLGLDSYKTIAIMDFPSTSAQSSSDLTATVTGAVAGTPVLLGVPNSSVVANTSYSAWVSSTNTVTVRFNNYSSSSANPASGSFYLIVLNL